MGLLILERVHSHSLFIVVGNLVCTLLISRFKLLLGVCSPILFLDNTGSAVLPIESLWLLLASVEFALDFIKSWFFMLHERRFSQKILFLRNLTLPKRHIDTFLFLIAFTFRQNFTTKRTS